MNCYYCDRIRAHNPVYPGVNASYDLASGAPRCARHWRFLCGQCKQPHHFMALAFCEEKQQLFCAACASGARETPSSFWGYEYHFEYRSPWSHRWYASLDRLEFEGRPPLPTAKERTSVVSPETELVRYPARHVQWRTDDHPDDGAVAANWNRNAERWDARYDDDGDPNRRYQSDEPMLAALGAVCGLDVLDLGSGNGYLCRKLARAGGHVTGVELSDRMLQLAREEELGDPLGINYLHGSVADMALLRRDSFDRAVSNYVLMDVLDYAGAINEAFRVLRPGGVCVVVISHPCFACGPADWERPAPDSPRQEDSLAFRVDGYFHRGPYFAQWGDLDPVLSFHRPLHDYWQAFAAAGFEIAGFEEPSLTERGRRELPPSRVARALRVPYSCLFRLVKPTL